MHWVTPVRATVQHALGDAGARSHLPLAMPLPLPGGARRERWAMALGHKICRFVSLFLFFLNENRPSKHVRVEAPFSVSGALSYPYRQNHTRGTVENLL
jgi:hypothetical protein